MSHFYIIGAGGVGSWLAPAVCLLVKPENVTIIDGDTLERGNLNRQLFTAAEIGKNKAQALAAKYRCSSVAAWYYEGLVKDVRYTDWLLSCVDNHPARRSILDTCDHSGCNAVFGGNEVTSSEAFFYSPEWIGTKLDPRTFYPEINTDSTGDPMAHAIGCTGDVQKQTRQLVTANMMAAALMGHLLTIWHLEATKKGVTQEVLNHLPFHLIQNASQNETRKVIDYVSTHKN
jgi:molybdopterin/thiamine biosynthesis adenylyltransferase